MPNAEERNNQDQEKHAVHREGLQRKAEAGNRHAAIYQGILAADRKSKEESRAPACFAKTRKRIHQHLSGFDRPDQERNQKRN